jgi:hypothetical protein
MNSAFADPATPFANFANVLAPLRQPRPAKCEGAPPGPRSGIGVLRQSHKESGFPVSALPVHSHATDAVSQARAVV